MHTRTPRAILAGLIDPVLSDRQCPHPDCGEWYDPSDPQASYPHNNHK